MHVLLPAFGIFFLFGLSPFVMIVAVAGEADRRYWRIGVGSAFLFASIMTAYAATL